jgi:UDP-galactopyranose mutase
MELDFLVVGSGLTGATIARLLHDQGLSVLVVDRRSHIGGNVHDHHHPSGIRIHTYGPHYFRTTSQRIWEFVNRFSRFYKYEAELLTLIDGQFEHWPIIQNYIEKHFGSGWKADFTGKPNNFEEASLAKMPRKVYEDFVKGYTEKQWGVPACNLSSELAGRFAIHTDNDTRLKQAPYQGLPLDGYAGLMNSLLQGVPVLLNFDYLKNRQGIVPKYKTIFTGPIDEFFDFDLGKLHYRGQIRKHEYYRDIDYIYPKGQINTPAQGLGAQVRFLEWKHMMPEDYKQRIKGTVITSEVPYTPENPDAYEYPFPDANNRSLYKCYQERTVLHPNILFCGRLGEYKYYDMDQAIARAMLHADRLLEEIRVEVSIGSETITEQLVVL